MLPRFFQAWLLLHLAINGVRHPHKQQWPEEIIDKYPDTLFLFARISAYCPKYLCKTIHPVCCSFGLKFSYRF